MKVKKHPVCAGPLPRFLSRDQLPTHLSQRIHLEVRCADDVPYMLMTPSTNVLGNNCRIGSFACAGQRHQLRPAGCSWTHCGRGLRARIHTTPPDHHHTVQSCHMLLPSPWRLPCYIPCIVRDPCSKVHSCRASDVPVPHAECSVMTQSAGLASASSSLSCWAWLRS